LKPGRYDLEVTVRANENLLAERRIIFEVIETRSVADTAPRRPEPLSDYLDLVAQYRSGHYEKAKARLGDWTGEEANRVVGDWVEDSVDVPTLEAAVLLHTEIALFGEEGLSSESRTEHFRVASDLVDRVDGKAEYQAFVRDWYLSLACFHHGGDLSLSEYFLKEAMRIAPEDPFLHLAMGSTYEIASWLSRDRGRLGDAEDHYRRALQLDPKMAEAHLRLGRILDERGGGKREDEALQELGWVATYADDPHLVYLAHLFLGDLYLERDDYPTAIQSYRAAVDAAPQWQTGYLSLSQALQVSGDRDGASELMEQALEVPVFEPDYLDGFRLYRLGQMGKLPDLLEKMREEVGL
jgi:tetratricopeptide (TPR) repeat protein